MVDKRVDDYPVELLEAYKVQHERWVETQLSSSMTTITQAELDVVCKHIAKQDGIPSTALTAVPPEEKMAHNGLGSLARKRLTIGLAQSSMVAEYLEKIAANVDSNFPAELRAGFVSEYEALLEAGLRGDALFVALSNFAGGEDGPNTTFSRQAAGLAVLAHLFQVCDVFEEVPA
ncbi:ABC-three component system protein [Micromonospora chalcea]|uniref:ABC-three component system protein n=1 Tax=Micromonospora chalcea TaxID=1874 RepID=UPI0033DF2418